MGAFKEFGDIDLLVDDELLNDKWQKLINIMQEGGFELVNEHEHEFRNSVGANVGFASENILIRDGIASLIKDIVDVKPISGLFVRTLTPQAFKKAYEFSVRDGYRINTRGKDEKIIALLDRYIAR